MVDGAGGGGESLEVAVEVSRGNVVGRRTEKSGAELVK